MCWSGHSTLLSLRPRCSTGVSDLNDILIPLASGEGTPHTVERTFALKIARAKARIRLMFSKLARQRHCAGGPETPATLCSDAASGCRVMCRVWGRSPRLLSTRPTARFRTLSAVNPTPQGFAHKFYTLTPSPQGSAHQPLTPRPHTAGIGARTPNPIL